MNIKEALTILHYSNSKFKHYPEDLNKLFMAKLVTPKYIYAVHHNALLNSLFLSISDKDKTSTICFTFTDDEIYISYGDERCLLPDSTASADEWFNFNIQCSGITKDELYPELDTIESLIFEEYKRVLMERLDSKYDF